MEIWFGTWTEGTYGTQLKGRNERINRHTGGTHEGNKPKSEAQFNPPYYEHAQINEMVRVSTSSMGKYSNIYIFRITKEPERWSYKVKDSPVSTLLLFL